MRLIPHSKGVQGPPCRGFGGAPQSLLIYIYGWCASAHSYSAVQNLPNPGELCALSVFAVRPQQLLSALLVSLVPWWFPFFQPSQPPMPASASRPANTINPWRLGVLAVSGIGVLAVPGIGVL